MVDEGHLTDLGDLFCIIYGVGQRTAVPILYLPQLPRKSLSSVAAFGGIQFKIIIIIMSLWVPSPLRPTPGC